MTEPRYAWKLPRKEWEAGKSYDLLVTDGSASFWTDTDTSGITIVAWEPEEADE